MSSPTLVNPRVLYICGWGRSGTTIVDRMLGQVPGFCSIGELRSLWDADPEVQRCGCGQVVAQCPLWGPLLRSIESVGGYSVRSIRSMRDDMARSRHLLGLRRAAGHRGHTSRSVTSYGDVLVGIYRALVAATGSGIIIDSSKHPADALLLEGRPDVDLTVLHLVRDPRGVAYSWSRSDKFSDLGNDRPPERGPLSSSAWWTVWNGAVEGLIRPLLGPRYMALRYEDVMADPAGTLGRVIQRLGGSGAELPLVGHDEVVLGAAHTVAGNPSRLRNGRISLVVDREWAGEMAAGDRWRATLPALPLLSHYGYRLRPPSALARIG